MTHPYFEFAGIHRGIITVADVATLRSVDSNLFNGGEQAYVLSTKMVYEWDASSATADDGVTVIKPTDVAGNGRWLIGNFVRPTSSVLYAGPAAAGVTVAGVAATPGWVVLSSFKLRNTTNRLALEACLNVSQGALTTKVRLYDTVGAAAVAGSTLTSTSTTVEYKTSADLASALTAERIYQIEAECTGGALATDFSVVSAGLVVM